MTADVPRTQGGLGRGLSALIPQRDENPAAVELPISAIESNPYQPRQGVEQTQLAALAASIGEHGVLQPILVTATAGGYRLIAGERRLRAAELAGLTHIPAVVRSADEMSQLALALIENLQRADLNPLEEARGFRQLVDEFGLSHDEVGTRVGRARSTIANSLRLLELAPEVQQALGEGRLTEGHARAIAGLDDPEAQKDALAAVTGRRLSVRQTEELVRRMRAGKPAARPQPQPSPDVERVEQGLREALGTKVTVSSGRRGGHITINYYDNDDLARLYERLTGGAND
jgi:ParB family chromosome partitioning protein